VHGVKAKNIASLFLLPGIVPRTRNLFSSGFGYVAFLMASIYNMVRLLPPGHPYLQPQNIGKFGIHHVIGEAANNLVVNRKNLDQLFIFIALLAAVVLLIMQFIILLYSLIVQPAFAQSIFDTPNPEKDIAFLMLDYVFGVPELFCNAAGDCTEISGNLPFPFHVALHDMLKFYSYGLLMIAVFIFLYFVVVLVGETAVTGSPFGKRFQNIWAPIRLVVALGLLVPIHHGLNSSQYITLFAAKYGSGLATNGWIRFNNAMADQSQFSDGNANPTGENGLLALPEKPDIAPTVQFMAMVQACRYAYWRTQEPAPNIDVPPVGPKADFFIKPYLVKQPLPWMSDNNPYLEVEAGTSYEDALDFYDNSDIRIVFGEHSDEYAGYTGNVKPTCGEIRVSTSDVSMKGTDQGTDKVQSFYFDLIKSMSGLGGGPDSGSSDKLIAMSWRFMELAIKADDNPQDPLQCKVGCIAGLPSCTAGDPLPCKTDLPSTEFRQDVLNEFNALIATVIELTWQDYNENADGFEISEDIMERGWGGAGTWYNMIAQANGSFIDAVINVPRSTHFPLIMEDVRTKKFAKDRATGSISQFEPHLAGGEEIKGIDIEVAKPLYDYMVYWYEDGINQQDADKNIIGNIFEVAMNAVFGTSGLFAMRGKNAHIHPLSQLTALGKGLVNSALINIGISLGASAGIFNIMFGQGLSQIAGEVISSTAFVGLTAGLVLFYILPFLPFVYFYFAVAQWVKGIFEAMVGAPLWALAHMRIDGEGLPGEAASNGYFLIFEIFARPIMIVIGLIAALLIFTAQVRILNFTWGLVVDNLTGFEVDVTLPAEAQKAQKNSIRGTIDQFFFTIIYAIIVYMLATSSFKMIDKVPDNILRWMGAGVSSFGDTNPDDPTQGLTRYVAIGGMTIGKQAVGGAKELAGGVGTLTGLRPTPKIKT